MKCPLRARAARALTIGALLTATYADGTVLHYGDPTGHVCEVARAGLLAGTWYPAEHPAEQPQSATCTPGAYTPSQDWACIHGFNCKGR